MECKERPPGTARKNLGEPAKAPKPDASNGTEKVEELITVTVQVAFRGTHNPVAPPITTVWPEDKP